MTLRSGVLAAVLFVGILAPAAAEELTPQQMQFLGIMAERSFKAPSRTRARDLTPQEMKIIADVVAHDFNDPESTRFRWLPVGDPMAVPGLFYYCASVNSKNLYGAYSGYRPFYIAVKPEKDRIVSAVGAVVADGDESEARMVLWVCAKAGAALPR